jgi:hypothetical protein
MIRNRASVAEVASPLFGFVHESGRTCSSQRESARRACGCAARSGYARRQAVVRDRNGSTRQRDYFRGHLRPCTYSKMPISCCLPLATARRGFPHGITNANGSIPSICVSTQTALSASLRSCRQLAIVSLVPPVLIRFCFVTNAVAASLCKRISKSSLLITRISMCLPQPWWKSRQLLPPLHSLGLDDGWPRNTKGGHH